MASTYSVTQAQSNLPRLIRESSQGLITLTRHDTAVAYVVSKERMEGILETLEILANPEAVKALQAAKAGKTKYHSLTSLDEG
jgi:PHD/YefM family antitoxin component YafN of YafNO toxin-antitoxin module